MRLCRAWSSSDSPMMRPARSVDRRPISVRSWANAAWRSASIWACAASMRRRASACASSRSSALICAACSRASSRSLAASCRASASCSRYSFCRAMAWACASSALLMPPSMASVRSASVFWWRGTSIRPATKKTTRNAKTPTTSSYVCGRSGLNTPSSCARSVAAIFMGAAFRQRFFRSLEGREEERRDQTDQGEGLDEDEAEEHVLADQGVRLGLPGDGLEALAEDDAHTDAGADDGEAVTDGGDVAGDLSENVHLLCFPLLNGR